LPPPISPSPERQSFQPRKSGAQLGARRLTAGFGLLRKGRFDKSAPSFRPLPYKGRNDQAPRHHHGEPVGPADHAACRPDARRARGPPLQAPPPGPPPAGAINAALLAASVLALNDDALAARLAGWRKQQTDSVAAFPEDRA